MNINDVKAEDLGITGDDKLDQIFRRQLELMLKYHEIEKHNVCITSDCPVNLHDAKGQYRLKDFAWRITEELGEALEAHRNHPHMPDHYNEELADALHFLVEFTILTGFQPQDIMTIQSSDDRLDRLFYLSFVTEDRSYLGLCREVGRVVECLAIACNCLKNKPWKSTRMMTDVDYFKECVIDLWFRFIQLCKISGLNSETVMDLYFRKSEVNKFRQRSNY